MYLVKSFKIFIFMLFLCGHTNSWGLAPGPEDRWSEFVHLKVVRERVDAKLKREKDLIPYLKLVGYSHKFLKKNWDVLGFDAQKREAFMEHVGTTDYGFLPWYVPEGLQKARKRFVESRTQDQTKQKDEPFSQRTLNLQKEWSDLSSREFMPVTRSYLNKMEPGLKTWWANNVFLGPQSHLRANLEEYLQDKEIYGLSEDQARGVRVIDLEDMSSSRSVYGPEKYVYSVDLEFLDGRRESLIIKGHRTQDVLRMRGYELKGNELAWVAPRLKGNALKQLYNHSPYNERFGHEVLATLGINEGIKARSYAFEGLHTSSDSSEYINDVERKERLEKGPENLLSHVTIMQKSQAQPFKNLLNYLPKDDSDDSDDPDDSKQGRSRKSSWVLPVKETPNSPNSNTVLSTSQALSVVGSLAEVMAVSNYAAGVGDLSVLSYLGSTGNIFYQIIDNEVKLTVIDFDYVGNTPTQIARDIRLGLTQLPIVLLLDTSILSRKNFVKTFKDAFTAKIYSLQSEQDKIIGKIKDIYPEDYGLQSTFEQKIRDNFELYKEPQKVWKSYLKALIAYAPYLAEELGEDYLVNTEKFGLDEVETMMANYKVWQGAAHLARSA